ncbi:MAG TPA: glycoside hydrolase family 38 C-terminal domain-containing protein [Armatimonadota bacterium]|jgi:alpha-mannosidase/mannosylglycerate hydrolase
MTNPTSRTLHVISHTHWDREWYLPFQQFRYRLVRLIDRLMDLLDSDPDFKVFHLDAQTIVLEDYLAVKPANRPRLEKFIREGRILVGPWYQLNDEFLVSGESTIRSLLIGHRIAAEFGGAMKIGYLPDQFGNISQMPQIFRGFDIPYAVVGRGRDFRPGDKMEFLWESPDGSSVLTSFLAYWYNNFERIPEDHAEAVARVKELTEKYMAPAAASSHLLFMNGVDHFEAQANLSGKMKAVNAEYEGGQLVHSTLDDYFKGVESENLDLQKVVGELRHGPSLGGLPGTLSSRVYLKQANARCQTLLERYAEPLCTIADAVGEKYPREYLTWAWKRLMENHPHDSICGCSQDQVHREMEVRFEEVRQVGDELVATAFGAIAENLRVPATVEMEGRHTTFAVFNALSFPRTDIAEVTIDFALCPPNRYKAVADESTDVQNVAVFDEEGEPVTFHIVSSEIRQTRVISPTVLPMAQQIRRFVIQVRAADVPPVGFKAFRVVGFQGQDGHSNAGATMATGAEGQRTTLVKSMGGLENEFLSVVVCHDGAFSINGPVGNFGCNTLEDGGDVGDEYVYRAPRRDAVINSSQSEGQIELVENTLLAAAYRTRMTLDLPAAASSDKEARGLQRVSLPVETTIRLRADQPWVEITRVVENLAKDHRLRTLFPTDSDAGVTFAQSAFDVIERPPVSRDVLSVQAGQHPLEQWVSVSGNYRIPDLQDFPRISLTVLTDGLYEHELLRDGEGTLALTLLRAVDGINMIKHDPLGHDRTPDAQCQRTLTFHYAVLPHQGTWEEDKVWKAAHAFNTPLLAMQTPEAERESPDYNRVRLALPAREGGGPGLLLEPDSLVLSAYKMAQDRHTRIVRFWNIGTQVAEGRAGIPGAKAAWRVNMNEERQRGLPIMEDGTVAITAKPKEIVTVEFEY